MIDDNITLPVSTLLKALLKAQCDFIGDGDTYEMFDIVSIFGDLKDDLFKAGGLTPQEIEKANKLEDEILSDYKFDF